MKKKQLIISLVPILGSFFYTCYLFFVDRAKFMKVFLPSVVGMGSFFAVYGAFAAFCNATALDLITYAWLLYLMLAISGMIWNVAYFFVFNRLTKNY